MPFEKFAWKNSNGIFYYVKKILSAKNGRAASRQIKNLNYYSCTEGNLNNQEFRRKRLALHLKYFQCGHECRGFR